MGLVAVLKSQYQYRRSYVGPILCSMLDIHAWVCGAALGGDRLRVAHVQASARTSPCLSTLPPNNKRVGRFDRLSDPTLPVYFLTAFHHRFYSRKRRFPLTSIFWVAFLSPIASSLLDYCGQFSTCKW